jgi:CAAX prenyl protease-like protein
MFSTEFDGLYPVRVLIVTATLWFFRRSYARWEWCWSWPAVGLGIVVFVFWMALASADLRRDGDGLPTALDTIPFGWRVTWLTFRVLGSVLMVPMVEELAFRGFLIRRLISADVSSVTPGQFTWFSFLLSSVLFGLLHQRWFAGTLAGMFYALALYRRGNLVEAIIAHAVTNGLIAATVLLWGQWWLW